MFYNETEFTSSVHNINLLYQSSKLWVLREEFRNLLIGNLYEWDNYRQSIFILGRFHEVDLIFFKVHLVCQHFSERWFNFKLIPKAFSGFQFDFNSTDFEQIKFILFKFFFRKSSTTIWAFFINCCFSWRSFSAYIFGWSSKGSLCLINLTINLNRISFCKISLCFG